MNEPKPSINQLRIDRSAPAPERRISKLWLVGLAVPVAAAAVWGFQSAKTQPAAAKSVVAPPAPSAPLPPTAALEATGYVIANRQATVAVKVTGRLTEVAFEEGQHVKAGQVLARLDNTNALASLNEAKAQVELGKANLKGKLAMLEISQRQLERQKTLHASGWVSGNAVDNAAASGESLRNEVEVAKGQLAVYQATLQVAQRYLEDTIVRAPFDGIVTVKAAQPGEIISPISAGGGFTRTGICTIVAMDSLEVSVDVSENFINRIRPGQPASITLNAYKDWHIPAEVIAVVPTADRTKATVGVRLALKEKDPRILPQMGVNVRFLNADTPDKGADAALKTQGAGAPSQEPRRSN